MFNKLPIYSDSTEKLQKALLRDLENLPTYHERYAALCLLENAIAECYKTIQPMATAEVKGSPEFRAAESAGSTECILHGGKFRISTKATYPLETVPEFAQKAAELQTAKDEVSVLNKELSAIKERLIHDGKLAPISATITLSFIAQPKPAKK